MPRTFIRQDTQIRQSDLYDDTIPPTVAAYETNPTNVEDDLNSIRSQLQNFLNRNGGTFPVGNWYDDCVAPITFENGSKRGINQTNQDLHDLQRKRVLVSMTNLPDVTVPAAVAATGNMTLLTAGNMANGDTVTTGSKVYTFQTVLTNVDGHVLIGVNAAATISNFVNAINLGPGSGTAYAAATTANGFVSAANTGPVGPNERVTVTAIVSGSVGNSIATTETGGNAAWANATLTGGAGDVKVLLIGELPTNTTAAIGLVTTRGTVAAYVAAFGSHSLNVVTGSNALDPKNLCTVVDDVSLEPLLSGGQVIHALFQTESSVDGSTMTGTTPNRAQLSFVRRSISETLEPVPVADIAGKIIHFSSVERKALEDLNEQDFLRGASIQEATATTVTRQVAYDNQGTVPVELLTNATLDLNSAGIYWQIRDLVNATLFKITEGSGGGTTTLQIAPDVDVFTGQAVVNNFTNGVGANTGGTRINVGVNAGIIETTGANDLEVKGAAKLWLDDSYQTGSTWVGTTGISLSASTAEWTTFKADFGEVSLLNAIAQAKNVSARYAKVYATVTVTTNANLDVGGIGGGTNLSAQLPNMSGGNFLTDYDVFLNGSLLRPGANSLANHDYYPGTSLANGQLMFEFKVKSTGTTPDVICVIPYA